MSALPRTPHSSANLDVFTQVKIGIATHESRTTRARVFVTTLALGRFASAFSIVERELCTHDWASAPAQCAPTRPHLCGPGQLAMCLRLDVRRERKCLEDHEHANVATHARYPTRNHAAICVSLDIAHRRVRDSDVSESEDARTRRCAPARTHDTGGLGASAGACGFLALQLGAHRRLRALRLEVVLGMHTARGAMCIVEIRTRRDACKERKIK
ncbi:hypothetical protein DFH08DRAFT_975171 [Mycena albidolilacea]|uniref:Uncharacterized protein n=1 Tax=Mycena albidolilacea TaxID=1033008 RepID=A0AAD6Z5A8_9AGAR|nr:hypothetical protein DFH08DRAFT_975171 [Mycena albidolilacea]